MIDKDNGVIEITLQLQEKIREEYDRFVFETVKPYCEGITQLVISKKILARALYFYQKEHFEEYCLLNDEAYKEEQ